jgi:hypothetical protein
MSLKTATERSEKVREMITDPDLDLTLTEAYSHIYHWLMYERAFRKSIKAEKAMRKHADILNANVDAFKLRKDMKNL